MIYRVLLADTILIISFTIWAGPYAPPPLTQASFSSKYELQLSGRWYELFFACNHKFAHVTQVLSHLTFLEQNNRYDPYLQLFKNVAEENE